MKIKAIKNLKCALRGLTYAFREQTVKILCLITLVVVFLMIFLGISFIEKTVILLTITLVLGLELINSQVEKTLNIVEPQFSQKVKEIKDISAGAVLIAGIGAALIGALIFLPYLFSLFGLN